MRFEALARKNLKKIRSDVIVYSRLAPNILERLKDLNPRLKNGYRKHKHHSFLTEDHGVPELKDHIIKVMGLIDASTNCKEFERLLNRAVPRVGSTMTWSSL